MYLHPTDAVIDRKDAYVYMHKQVLLLDEEGNEVFRFPWDWTDDQILHALNFANRAWHAGVQRGEHNKQREIQKVWDFRRLL